MGSRCSEAETSPGSLHRLPKCAPAAVPASSRAAMPTGALHGVPAGLRGCAPEDPSEDKPDLPKKTCGGGGAPSLPPAPERQTSSGGYRSGATSNELVFTGALGSNSNVKSAPQTRAGSDAINFG